MNRADFDSFRRMASTLTPAAVTRFLAAQGWTRENRINGVKEIWSRPAVSDSADQVWVMVPLAVDYVDFERRFSEALILISQVHECDAEELSRQINSSVTDFFSVRLVRSSADNTVPITEGEMVISEIKNLLRKFADATETGHVRRRGGRSPKRASDFMRNHARLGHTRSGSFVITFAALLEEPELPPGPRRHGDDRRRAFDEPVPFARQVMTSLAEAIETASELRSTPYELGAAGASEEIRRAELVVETMAKFRSFDKLEEIDLSFTWASGLPVPTVGLGAASFRPGDLSRTPSESGWTEAAAATRSFSREHAIQDAPTQMPSDLLKSRISRPNTTVSGIVHSLERRPDGGGTVTLLVDDGGASFDVRIRLRAPDYRIAVQAHLADLPVSASGDLTEVGSFTELHNAALDTAKIEADLRTLP